MRKLVKYLLLVFTLFTFLAAGTTVFSQTEAPAPTPSPGTEFNYDRAYQDYYYNNYLYQKALSDYQSARATYLSINNLDTKEAARVATRDMLSARDETIRTYLTALRMKLRETTGLSDAEKDATYSQIDAQIAWYNDHKDKLPSAQTLEDLVSDSNSAKDHFTATTAIIYSTLVQIDSGKIRGLRGEQVKVIDSLNQKIGQISQNGDKNVIPLERAISDIQNKVDRSVAKESEAQVAILKVQQKGASAAAMAAAYEDAIARLNDAFLYLKDINLNLQDVVRQIKTQD